METKLTLRLRKSVIERAKEYAHNQKISLSKMIEIYLESITASKEEVETTPLVESLSGVIELDPDFDYKREYSIPNVLAVVILCQFMQAVVILF
jgi:hypothetical protein